MMVGACGLMRNADGMTWPAEARIPQLDVYEIDISYGTGYDADIILRLERPYAAPTREPPLPAESHDLSKLKRDKGYELVIADECSDDTGCHDGDTMRLDILAPA